MADKVQLIKEEIERRMENILKEIQKSDKPRFSLIGKINSLEELLSFIDSLPEESGCEVNFTTKNEDWEEEFNRFLDEKEGVPRMWHSDEQMEWGMDIARHFAEWGRNHFEDKSEKVSDGLDEAAKHYLYGAILYDDVYVGNPTEEDCIRCFKAGAKWQRKKDKESSCEANCTPENEDLEKVAIDAWNNNVGLELMHVEEVIGFANEISEWQKQKDQEIIELAEDHAMLAGMNRMKEEMMKNAVYGYVSLCHDYPHRRSLVAVEDGLVNFEYAEKVKIIIIKEE